eukprot:4511674-Pleurochrysis_carterae.AAC.2
MQTTTNQTYGVGGNRSTWGALPGVRRPKADAEWTAQWRPIPLVIACGAPRMAAQQGRRRGTCEALRHAGAQANRPCSVSQSYELLKAGAPSSDPDGGQERQRKMPRELDPAAYPASSRRAANR